jgi:5,10-methylene-tetrahydrofolate dehydrogenase/methenyl tetrahydrofolate cyclohydrolase
MSISIEIVAQCNECNEVLNIESYYYKNNSDCLIVSIPICDNCRFNIQQSAIDEYKDVEKLNKDGE